MDQPEQQQPEDKRYTPGEVAKIFGITTHTLAEWRRYGKIQGTEEKNITYYTLAQIRAVDLTRRKPGPKPRGGREMTQTGENSSSVACIRKYRRHIPDLVGA